MIINGLNDEQMDELMEFLEENFLPEPPNTVHSREELMEKLEKAEESFRRGEFYTEEEMNEFFRENFGI